MSERDVLPLGRDIECRDHARFSFVQATYLDHVLTNVMRLYIYIR